MKEMHIKSVDNLKQTKKGSEHVRLQINNLKDFERLEQMVTYKKINLREKY